MEMAVRSYVALLMAIGEIGFGWLLAFHSRSMVTFFSSEKRSGSRFVARILGVSGWIFLIGGCLGIAMFLVLMVYIAFQSLSS